MLKLKVNLNQIMIRDIAVKHSTRAAIFNGVMIRPRIFPDVAHADIN